MYSSCRHEANSRAAHAAALFLSFTGWTQYGFWHNGELLTRAQYRDRYSPVGFVKAEVKPKAPISAKQARTPRRYIAAAAHGLASATPPAGLTIPSLAGLIAL